MKRTCIHCIHYRAPVLVAIALIEFGMEPLDAVEYVRRKRRGAFNKPQISYLVCLFYPCLSFLLIFRLGYVQTIIETKS